MHRTITPATLCADTPSCFGSAILWPSSWPPRRRSLERRSSAWPRQRCASPGVRSRTCRRYLVCHRSLAFRRFLACRWTPAPSSARWTSPASSECSSSCTATATRPRWVRPCCGPLSQPPGPDPPGLPAQAHPAHLGRHLASPRAALPHASWGSSKSSTARWLRSWTRPPPRRCPTRSCSSSACARAAGTSATRRSTASSASSAAGSSVASTWNPRRCSTRSR